MVAWCFKGHNRVEVRNFWEIEGDCNKLYFLRNLPEKGSSMKSGKTCRSGFFQKKKFKFVFLKINYTDKENKFVFICVFKRFITRYFVRNVIISRKVLEKQDAKAIDDIVCTKTAIQNVKLQVYTAGALIEISTTFLYYLIYKKDWIDY